MLRQARHASLTAFKATMDSVNPIKPRLDAIHGLSEFVWTNSLNPWIASRRGLIGFTESMVALKAVSDACRAWRSIRDDFRTGLSRRLDRRVPNPEEGFANQRSRPCRLAERVGFEPTVRG